MLVMLQAKLTEGDSKENAPAEPDIKRKGLNPPMLNPLLLKRTKKKRRHLDVKREKRKGEKARPRGNDLRNHINDRISERELPESNTNILEAPLLENFKMSQMELYEGRADPRSHLSKYNHLMQVAKVSDDAKCLFANVNQIYQGFVKNVSFWINPRGSARLQVVNDNARNVFDDELKDGQIFVVPQNFMMVKKASAQGFKWIVVKTNDNAMRNPLAGKVSAMRAMLDYVLANAFQTLREQGIYTIEHKMLQLPIDNVNNHNMKLFRGKWCLDLFY
ncbi:11S globulin seed storage protein 1-like [Cannabis sativa]|uniref:11S globulin seed storage protein 1-like n=1 Tax=Cannabis sativa TaxID=3483 RepID=UPI0011DF38FD|nr:11S globulin seed storage protein 1-like [Cannabis sativa]